MNKFELYVFEDNAGIMTVFGVRDDQYFVSRYTPANVFVFPSDFVHFLSDLSDSEFSFLVSDTLCDESIAAEVLEFYSGSISAMLGSYLHASDCVGDELNLICYKGVDEYPCYYVDEFGNFARSAFSFIFGDYVYPDQALSIEPFGYDFR